MGRKADLEKNIQQSYELIREYEDIRSLSSDPKEQARAGRNINEQWQLVKDYFDEYIPLCQRLGINIPKDLLEIVASFSEYQAFFAQPTKLELDKLTSRPAEDAQGANVTDSAKNRQPSVLLIGHSFHTDVECVEWDAPEPNVADYDVVIMDLTTLQKTLPPLWAYSVTKRSEINMSKYLQWHRIQDSIERLLLSGGRLFIIAKPDIVIHPGTPAASVQSVRDEIPLPFLLYGDRMSGKSIAWVHPEFEFYFQQMESWQSFLTGKLDDNFSKKLTYRVHPLAKSRANEALAISIWVWRDGSETPGVIYLLPPPTQTETFEAIKLILIHLDDLEKFSQRRGREVRLRQEQPSIPINSAITWTDNASSPPEVAMKPQPQATSQEITMSRNWLPSGLANPLRLALLDCGPFDTDRQLRAVFSHPNLALWRDRLPGAENRQDRVDFTIDFMLAQRTSKGVNGLILLLQVLRERIDPGDACHQRLGELANALVQAYSGDTAPKTNQEGAATNAEEFASLRRQLVKLKRNLLTIEEQKVEHIDPRNVPPDLVEAEKQIREKIAELEARQAGLDPPLT